MPQARFKPRSSIHTYDSLANLKLGVLERVLQRAFGDGNMDAWFDSLIQVIESNDTAIINAINMIPGQIGDTVRITDWPEDPLRIVELGEPTEIPDRTLWYWQDATFGAFQDSHAWPPSADGWWFCPLPPSEALSSALVSVNPRISVLNVQGQTRTLDRYLDVYVDGQPNRTPNPATLAGNSFFADGVPTSEQCYSVERGFESWLLPTSWQFLRSYAFRHPQGGAQYRMLVEHNPTDNLYRNVYFVRDWAILVEHLQDGSLAHHNSTYQASIFTSSEYVAVKHRDELSNSEPSMPDLATHRIYLTNARTMDRLGGSSWLSPIFTTTPFVIPVRVLF